MRGRGGGREGRSMKYVPTSCCLICQAKTSCLLTHTTTNAYPFYFSPPPSRTGRIAPTGHQRGAWRPLNYSRRHRPSPQQASSVHRAVLDTPLLLPPPHTTAAMQEEEERRPPALPPSLRPQLAFEGPATITSSLLPLHDLQAFLETQTGARTRVLEQCKSIEQAIPLVALQEAAEREDEDMFFWVVRQGCLL